MKNLYKIFFITLMSLCLNSQAQTRLTEERFQDLFITAGYSTAFGAALGAAVIGLSNNPSENVKYIAMGASLGFIVGSVFGSYIVFMPMIAAHNEQRPQNNGSTEYSSPIIASNNKSAIIFKPRWNSQRGVFDAWETTFQIASF